MLLNREEFAAVADNPAPPRQGGGMAANLDAFHSARVVRPGMDSELRASASAEELSKLPKEIREAEEARRRKDALGGPDGEKALGLLKKTALDLVAYLDFGPETREAFAAFGVHFDPKDTSRDRLELGPAAQALRMHEGLRSADRIAVLAKEGKLPPALGALASGMATRLDHSMPIAWARAEDSLSRDASAARSAAGSKQEAFSRGFESIETAAAGRFSDPKAAAGILAGDYMSPGGPRMIDALAGHVVDGEAWRKSKPDDGRGGMQGREGGPWEKMKETLEKTPWGRAALAAGAVLGAGAGAAAAAVGRAAEEMRGAQGGKTRDEAERDRAKELAGGFVEEMERSGFGAESLRRLRAGALEDQGRERAAEDLRAKVEAAKAAWMERPNAGDPVKPFDLEDAAKTPRDPSGRKFAAHGEFADFIKSQAEKRKDGDISTFARNGRPDEMSIPMGILMRKAAAEAGEDVKTFSEGVGAHLDAWRGQLPQSEARGRTCAKGRLLLEAGVEGERAEARGFGNDGADLKGDGDRGGDTGLSMPLPGQEKPEPAKKKEPGFDARPKAEIPDSQALALMWADTLRLAKEREEREPTKTFGLGFDRKKRMEEDFGMSR